MWRVFLLLGVHQENLRWCLQSFKWISRRNQASLRVRLGFPYWLGDSPTCSQTYHNRSHDASIPVIRDPSSSKCRPECTPRVWISPEIEASTFTLCILSQTPGRSQWQKYILLMTKLYMLVTLIEDGIVRLCLEVHVSGKCVKVGFVRDYVNAIYDWSALIRAVIVIDYIRAILVKYILFKKYLSETRLQSFLIWYSGED